MKIYKVIIALLATSLLFFLVSCSKTEEIITTELQYESFDAINVKNFANVSINYGATQQVVFKGNENYLASITNKVVDGELLLQNNNIDFTNVKAEYIITLPLITKVSIDGISSTVINDFENIKTLAVNIKGNGAVKINELQIIEELEIDASGDAQIEMLSDTKDLQNLNITASGNIDFQGYQIRTKNSKIDFSGTGSIKIWVKEYLSSKITGIGTVFYKGYPTIETHSASRPTAEIINQN